VAGFRRVSEELVHEGYIWRVTTAEFEAPDGSLFRRDIVRSPGAVGVVPLWVDAEGTPSVILIRQYRPPYEDEILEIPAGMRDVPGEPPDVTAGRELIEEIGYAAGALQLLTEMYPSPGLTDSVTHVFLATQLTAVVREAHGPEEEHSSVVHVSLAEALDWVERGVIRDAKTVVGLLLTERMLR
jgi:ADP-ribose pyrophosphatase